MRSQREFEIKRALWARSSLIDTLAKGFNSLVREASVPGDFLDHLEPSGIYYGSDERLDAFMFIWHLHPFPGSGERKPTHPHVSKLTAEARQN
jgi:hypothetical protein